MMKVMFIWLEWKSVPIFLNSNNEDGCYIAPEVSSFHLDQSVLYLTILFLTFVSVNNLSSHSVLLHLSTFTSKLEHNNQYYVIIGCLFE